MGKINGSTGAVLLLLFVVLGFPRPAAAYIDPGSGSYLLQILVAGLLGASFAIKRFWGNIKSYFRGSASVEDETSE